MIDAHQTTITVTTQPTIGVLGGMGPRATVLVYERLVHRLELRGAGAESPRILIHHLPVSNMFDGRPDELRALLPD